MDRMPALRDPLPHVGPVVWKHALGARFGRNGPCSEIQVLPELRGRAGEAAGRRRATMQHIVEVAFDFNDKQISEYIEKQLEKDVTDGGER